MKISKGGVEIFQTIHEIYETFKRENFITHLYVHHSVAVVQPRQYEAAHEGERQFRRQQTGG